MLLHLHIFSVNFTCNCLLMLIGFSHLLILYTQKYLLEIDYIKVNAFILFLMVICQMFCISLLPSSPLHFPSSPPPLHSHSIPLLAVTGTIEKMFHTTYYLYPTSPVISNKGKEALIMAADNLKYVLIPLCQIVCDDCVVF